jgi:hypothetical protein
VENVLRGVGVGREAEVRTWTARDERYSQATVGSRAFIERRATPYNSEMFEGLSSDELEAWEISVG